MFPRDLIRVLRSVFGGGSDIDLPAEFDELKEALRTLAEASVATGIADATSTVNFLDDISKSWPPSPGGFENLIVEITEGTGVGNFAKISSNTATRITFAVAMPVAPDATSKYRIGFFGKMASDITAWGGTAQAGLDIGTELPKKVNNATTPVIYNVAMADADTEYSQALPANTKRFSIHLRDFTEVRVAYEAGKVAAPTEPYETIPVGHEKHEEMIEPASLTLYFASPAATKVAEIEAWS